MTRGRVSERLGRELRLQSLTHPVPWTEVVAGFTDASAEPVRAIPKNIAVYESLRKKYAEFEAQQINRR